MIKTYTTIIYFPVHWGDKQMKPLKKGNSRMNLPYNNILYPNTQNFSFMNWWNQ